MDTFEANLRQIRSQGIEGPWFEIMQVVDEGHVDTVMELAAATLPLEEIASGPADELGLGREFAPHGALVMIVQELGRFPGHGWELLRTALRSPVVNNRNMALDALEAWGADNWPPEAVPVLEASLKAEPVDELRSRIRSLLDSSARMQ
jgi:hypothetical protein